MLTHVVLIGSVGLRAIGALTADAFFVVNAVNGVWPLVFGRPRAPRGGHRGRLNRWLLYRSVTGGSATFRGMVLISFRSRLTPDAGEDYQAMDAELEARVREQPGYVNHRSYQAADGERLTLVWFRDQESLRSWRTLPRHAEAQRRGRERWYEFYEMEVAEIVRTSSFRRGQTPT